VSAPVIVTPLATYRNPTPYPFCPGCGHGSILDQLDAALGRLALDPRRVVIVSDIGCSGLSDQYFDTQAFHGLHGRSLTYATGLKLARPELTVIVVMGDGGTGIGGAHLLAAARRNLDLTVLVFDNFNFGMTGGQHSGTTPAGALTATTPDGSLERPLDLCATVAAAGASWVYRGTSFDADLDERVAEAIRHPGFALLDVWEPCTAYFAPRNRLTKKAISDLVDQLGFRRGLVRRTDAPEYGAAYRAAGEAATAGAVMPRPIEPRFAPTLDRRFSLVLAGSAGGRVGTAARLVARAAVLSGLHAAQRNDYPVTVKTGYSLAELVLSPEPIDEAGIGRASGLVVLSSDGRKQALAYLKTMDAAGRVFATPEAGELPAPCPVELVDPAAMPKRITKDLVAVAVTAVAVARLGLVPAAALLAAAEREEEAVRAALAAGLDLAATRVGGGEGRQRG
jgi:pyruvate/2-oxoacid:ferredoxin oxidoreductase beta subunit/Pyruvate/2-oxoacid:ferredoxin oxidoreductase gamma subunit